jgi:hypothetical protein
MGLNHPWGKGTIRLAIPGRTWPGSRGSPCLPHGPKGPQAGANQAQSTSTIHLWWTTRSKKQMYKRAWREGSNPSLHSCPFFQIPSREERELAVRPTSAQWPPLHWLHRRRRHGGDTGWLHEGGQRLQAGGTWLHAGVCYPVVRSIPSGGWLDPVGGGQDLVDSGARWQAGGSSYLFMPR